MIHPKRQVDLSSESTAEMNGDQTFDHRTHEAVEAALADEVQKNSVERINRKSLLSLLLQFLGR